MPSEQSGDATVWHRLRDEGTIEQAFTILVMGLAWSVWSGWKAEVEGVASFDVVFGIMMLPFLVTIALGVRLDLRGGGGAE